MITFRLANTDDIHFIHHSLHEMAIEQELKDRFSQTIETLMKNLFTEAALAEVMLAIHDVTPVGLCLFSNTNRNFDLFNRSGLYIHDIYVAPNFRRMGISQRLMNEIINVAKKRNCDRIDGVVIKDNKLGQSLLKSLKSVKKVDYIDYVRLDLTSPQ